MKLRKLLITFYFLLMLVLCLPLSATAQEGHPLDGTWSGDRIVDGDKVRVLLIMKLLPDQRIETTLVENGARIAVNDVTLDPSDWTMSMTVDGKSRNGETVQYAVEAELENLGSMFDRRLTGTWRSGAESGEFRLKMN